MSRRGEGQFVCAEVGLVNNPHLAALARVLRVSRVQALGHLMLWREFVLTWGSATGVVRDYTLDDVAAFVQWSGATKKIAEGLKASGYLATRRGALVYPHWLDTPTGEYAKNRADARAYEREKKRLFRESQRGTSPGMSPGTTQGHPGDVLRDGGDQSIKDVPGTPPPSPPPGGVEAAARLEWFEDNYPKGIAKKEFCRAILGGLEAADWAHLQFALGKQALSIWWRERGRAPKPEDWLRHLEWRRTKLPKPGKKPPPPDPAEIERRQQLEREQLEQAERLRKTFEQRASIKQRLIAAGVPRHQLEERIDQELASGLVLQ